jgi:lipoprotein-anchoring transpeptidase ErfK/SrfK
MPTLSPPVAGDWSVQGQTLTFTPTSGYQPWSTEQVTIPGTLAQPVHYSFAVGAVPLLRYQELLAELHYLPLRFGPNASISALRTEATTPVLVRTTAEPGVFTWRYPNTPKVLSSLWTAGQENVVTEGALMTFEAQLGLPEYELIVPEVWDALTAATAKRDQNTKRYHYLMVSETLPEQLVVWQDGTDVYTTPVNTGATGATTPIGTWPVYARFTVTTMKGTDPDGVEYNIKNVPWVAYFYGGDAVHGFVRSGYGYPQSNGCVELPVGNSKLVWGMDPIGTLVTITK